MRRITRNLFQVLTGICLVALIVFIVQYFILNRDREPVSTGSLATGGTAVYEPPTAPVENPFDNYVPPPPTERPAPEGTRRNLLIDPSTGAMLIIYAQEDKFHYQENEYDWTFQYRGGGNASLIIRFEHLLVENASDGSEDILNKRAGTSDADYKGLQTILDSPLTGYYVIAQGRATIHEAWLHRLGGSNLVLAFILNYEFNDQREDLYKVLSSISIEQG